MAWSQGGGQRLAEQRLDHLPADSAYEAVGVVGLPKRRHHFPFNEAVTAEAARAIEPLVVTCANVLTLPHEEATLGQVTATRCGEDRRLAQCSDQLIPPGDLTPAPMMQDSTNPNG